MGFKKVKKQDGTTAVIQTGKGGKGIVGNLGSEQARNGIGSVDKPDGVNPFAAAEVEDTVSALYSKFAASKEAVVDSLNVDEILKDVLNENYVVKFAPGELVDLANSVLKTSENITIAWDPHGDGDIIDIDLRSMVEEGDAMLTNSCKSVTQAVIKKLEAEGGIPEGYTVSEFVLDYKKGYHVALLFTDREGKEFIVDFTSRQYDNWLPFAMVEPKERWEKVIDHYVGKNFYDHRIDDGELSL